MIERILGPVAALELTRLSRQRRFFVLRVTFIVALLLMLYFRMPTDAVDDAELANAASRMYQSTLLIALVAVYALTPAVVCPAIAGEIATGRLTFLLMTPLSVREIVLGKGVARALIVGQVLLGAVPVIGLLQLSGGVSWEELVLGTLGVCVALGGVVAGSLFASIMSRTPRTATVGVYGFLALLWFSPIVTTSKEPELAWLMPAPPFVFPSLILLAVGCHVFHGKVCGHLDRVPRPTMRGVRRPIGKWAVWWWERAGDRSLWSWLIWSGLAVLTTFAALAANLSRPIWIDLPLTCSIVGMIALWRVAILAALSFADERNRDMLDLLRTTPISSGEVLFSKWLACVVAPWRSVVVLAVCFVFAMLSGANPWAVFLLALWLVYACGVSAVGVMVSILTRRAVTAVAVTLGLMTLATGAFALHGSGWSLIGWQLTLAALGISTACLRRRWEPRRPAANPSGGKS